MNNNIKKYIEFLFDLLIIDNEPNIKLTKDPNVIARFETGENTIYINENLSDIKFYESITHEIRHVYQLQCLINKDTKEQSKETLEKWESEFNNYKNKYDSNYINQEVEECLKYSEFNPKLIIK